MRLVFIHGWGFDKRFWQNVAALLPDHERVMADLGYFGDFAMPSHRDDDILIGHSFGFVRGMHERNNWRGWVAVNSFARFAGDGACVPASSLRGLRMMMGISARGTLAQFYNRLGADAPEGDYDADKLIEGLEALEEADLSAILPRAAAGLILAASDDPLVPSDASKALANLSPSSRIEMSATGGHLLPLKRAEWCAREIQDYLADV